MTRQPLSLDTSHSHVDRCLWIYHIYPLSRASLVPFHITYMHMHMHMLMHMHMHVHMHMHMHIHAT